MSPLVRSYLFSLALSKVLGATWPGAIVMGLGGALWEAGAYGVPDGWRRYALGIFSKAEKRL
jgi:hypothetical protein